MARLAALPGVDGVAQAASIPLGNSHEGTEASVPGHADQRDVEFNAVSPNFFATMTIPIVRGRTFSGAEVQTDAKAIIVTEAAARRFWPGEDAVGRKLMLYMPGNPVYEVVGVAKDAQVSHLGEAHPSYLYLPAGPEEQVGQQLLVHAATGFDASQNGIRAAVGALDPQLAVRVLPLADYLEFWRAPSRLAAILAVALGALALLLASIGVYGMVSYAVSRRTREIGIRLALGADGSDVVKLILQQALRPVIWGASAGIACCAAVSRVLTGLLFGVSAMDPLTFVVVAVLLVLVAQAACYIPARRATRVDPMVALRYE